MTHAPPALPEEPTQEPPLPPAPGLTVITTSIIATNPSFKTIAKAFDPSPPSPNFPEELVPFADFVTILPFFTVILAEDPFTFIAISSPFEAFIELLS